MTWQNYRLLNLSSECALDACVIRWRNWRMSFQASIDSTYVYVSVLKFCHIPVRIVRLWVPYLLLSIIPPGRTKHHSWFKCKLTNNWCCSKSADQTNVLSLVACSLRLNLLQFSFLLTKFYFQPTHEESQTTRLWLWKNWKVFFLNFLAIGTPCIRNTKNIVEETFEAGAVQEDEDHETMLHLCADWEKSEKSIYLKLIMILGPLNVVIRGWAVRCFNRLI